MPLFGPKQPCPHCGKQVREPKDRAHYLCPHCQNPGPWADADQVTAWERWKADEARALVAKQDHERALALAQQQARQRALEGAASLRAVDVTGFVKQKTEVAYMEMAAHLGEWKKQRGHYQGGGGIRGVSFKVPGLKGVRAYYGGLSPRTYVPGEEGWMITESGTAIITNRRIIYRGTKGMEWQFAKLVNVGVDESNGCLVLQVTNRQKPNLIQPEDPELFLVCLNASLERFQS